MFQNDCICCNKRRGIYFTAGLGVGLIWGQCYTEVLEPERKLPFMTIILWTAVVQPTPPRQWNTGLACSQNILTGEEEFFCLFWGTQPLHKMLNSLSAVRALTQVAAGLVDIFIFLLEGWKLIKLGATLSLVDLFLLAHKPYDCTVHHSWLAMLSSCRDFNHLPWYKQIRPCLLAAFI